MLYQFTSYSKYLRAELEQRKAANSLYSLRSMSQQIGVSSTTLSDVIKGKKKLSEKTALMVSKNLKLTPKQEKYFQTLVHYENSQDDNLRKVLESQLIVLNPLIRKQYEVEDDKYVALSEWHHVAILELTYIFPKKLTPAIVSEELSIDLPEAEAALNLLERISFLERNGESYAKSSKQVIFNSEISNQAIRHFHRTMLNKAQSAIIEQSNKEKFIGSETFPLAIEDLSEAKDIIENCFQQLLQLSTRSKNRKHIYHAGIQMFQLNKKKIKDSAND